MCREQHMKALEAFDDACRLAPSNKTFLHAKGICLFRTGRNEEAMRLFKDILAEKPEDVVSLAYCCEISARQNRPGEAGEYAERMLKRNPDDHFALRRKVGLDGGKGGIQRQEWKRLQLITRRLEEIARIINKAHTDKMMGCIRKRSLRQTSDRKGGEHAEYGIGGISTTTSVRPLAPWGYKQ
jgi:tetratricopeptide (TPR) repeat protein